MLGQGARQASSIYVSNLPVGTNETLLAEHFGQIGLLKKDKRTGKPKIWIYRDKNTNEPKGDATVTYEDPHAASAAVEWFDNKDFRGNLISVSIAESRTKDTAEQAYAHANNVADPTIPADYAGEYGGYGAAEAIQAETGPASEYGGTGAGRGRGDTKWQQEGDWQCPNPSCENINFSFRGWCNRCNTSRPAGAGGGSAGGGRGRGRGATESAGRGGRGAPWGGGPNDWRCPMCMNINWAKRTKCNICNTTKPGHTEGGVREGRGGGYKELDEAELEETKRRRRELEDDDGEMYDEFGNLKKKFRLRAKQGEGSGLGNAGWDKEELGVIEKDSKRNRNSSDDRHHHREEHNGYRKEEDREADVEPRSRRDRDWDRDRRERDGRSKERERERDRDRDRDKRSGR